MYRGQLVETGPTVGVIDGPHHPYTARLVRAANRREHERTTADPESTALETEPAVPQPTVGCRYADRCPLRHEPCLTDAPPVRVLDGEHAVRCHLPADRLPRTPQRRTA
jgi:peptide/nickel transport system ATP-binding protein